MGDRFLFLDIDGVLATSSTYARWSCPHRREWIPAQEVGWHREHELLGASQVKWLNELCALSDCRIVISSTWRQMVPWARLCELFRMAGVHDHPVGCTPDRRRHRGDDIAAWMAERGVKREDVVIFDDLETMGALEGRTVRTTMRVGLGRRHVRRALDLWGVSDG